MSEVKFVSYTGKYPNLCDGVLTVTIDGKEYKFGHEEGAFDWTTCKYNDDNFEKFWRSGGHGRVEEDDFGCLYPVEGDWELSIDCEYPDSIKNALVDLIRVFNENVEPGCCGGCI